MPKIQSPFRLDKELHWARLSSEERSRQEALLEFLTTEQSYYERLTILYQVYPKGFSPHCYILQVFFQPSSEFLSLAERKVIFQNLDELLLRSGLFLADLRERQLQGSGVIAAVSDLFLEHVPAMVVVVTMIIVEIIRLLSDLLYGTCGGESTRPQVIRFSFKVFPFFKSFQT